MQGALSFAEIRVKKPGSTGALTGWDKFGGGTDLVYMNGQITRTGKNTFVVKDVYFTPCDCGKDRKPVFSIKARKAWVELGSHALFERPVVQPLDQPFPFPFALPALYVPVSKRKSGLLPPAPRGLGADGFYIEDSIFFVLSDSVDMTAVAGYNVRRGLRDKLELRFNPTADVQGDLTLTHMSDDTFIGNNAGLFGSQRFGGSFNTRMGTWSRASLKANLQFFSDPSYFADNALSLAAQATQYSASRAAVDYRGDAWRLSVGAAAYQDFTLPNTGVAHSSFFSAGAGRTMQRLPDALLSVAPVPLPLGFRFALDTHFVASVGLSGDGLRDLQRRARSAAHCAHARWNRQCAGAEPGALGRLHEADLV